MHTAASPRYEALTPPVDGEPLSWEDGDLEVPSRPIIPFIEGDGTGPDIWRAAKAVLEAAVTRAYGSEREIVWFEVLAGQKAFDSLRRRSAAASGRSTWPCASSSTCSRACGPCAGSKASRRRCDSRSSSTW